MAEMIFLSDAKGDRFVPADEPHISVYDHGLLYGDGVFEGIRIYNSRLFKLKEHIDRLYDSAKEIKLVIPKTKDELIKKLIELCRMNSLTESGYIRLVVTRGIGNLGVNPKKCAVPTIFAIASNIQMYPKEFYETGLKVVIAHTKRISSDALSPNAKSLNYLNNIQACVEANAADASEAIMRDKDGFIAECTADNIFCVVDNEILTPMDRNVLKGVTREAVIELARQHSIPFFKTDISLKKLFRASEVFLTGTAAEIAPITKIGQDLSYGDEVSNINWRVIGNGSPGPITKKLMESFKEYVKDPRNSIPIYESWF